MTYPGGKGKTYQHMINIMPPHKVYVEPFVGSGAVVKKKKPSKKTIVNDLDIRVINNLIIDNTSFMKHNLDALDVLKSIKLDSDTLIYCDPPYLTETRRKNKIYRFEYSKEQHLELLSFLINQDCMVIISGYDNDVYNNILKGWSKKQFSAQTQAGPKTETIWYNFSEPGKLHDSRFLGSNFRERQNIKRRQERIKAKVDQMNPVERTIFIDWIKEKYVA